MASHKQNDQSSRSDAIFLIEMQQRVVPIVRTSSSSSAPQVATSLKLAPPLVSSCIALVDLAGSERVKKSGVEGLALQEAQAINKSLSAYCSVIHALYHKQPHIQTHANLASVF